MDNIAMGSITATPSMHHGPLPVANVPFGGRVASMCITLITLPILGACLTRRIERIQKWHELPVAAWLLLAIYIDSFLFVFATAVIKDIGINTSSGICDGGMLLCLTFYLSTKVLVYTFLCEKAWIVRGPLKSRLSSKLYLFNFLGMILPYIAAVIFAFGWRVTGIDSITGVCHYDMQPQATLALIILEVIINVYLNLVFLLPLRRLYHDRSNPKLRNLAFRTFVGSCATLASSVTNLVVFFELQGEVGWICLMVCNADILFSVLVLHWVTSFDGVRADERVEDVRVQCRDEEKSTMREYRHEEKSKMLDDEEMPQWQPARLSSERPCCEKHERCSSFKVTKPLLSSTAPDHGMRRTSPLDLQHDDVLASYVW